MNDEALADQLEIRELMARYCRAVDASDPAAFAELFTADGSFESETRSARGHVALAEMIAPVMGRSAHTTTDSIVEVTADEARHSCTVVVYTREPAGTERAVRLVARYEDELSRTAAGWRIARRVVRPMYEVATPAV